MSNKDCTFGTNNFLDNRTLYQRGELSYISKEFNADSKKKEKGKNEKWSAYVPSSFSRHLRYDNLKLNGFRKKITEIKLCKKIKIKIK